MTLKRTSNILDKSLKELSIQVSLSGLSFCIRDGADERITHLEHTVFEEPSNAEKLVDALETLLEEKGQSESQFKEVRVIHDNELSTFVPKALFNESNLSDYLKYNVKLLETDYIGFDEMPSHEMYNVYVPFTNVNNYIFDRFGSFEYKHSSTILVETLLNQFGSHPDQKVYIQVAKSTFEVVVIANGKLLMHNRFPYQTREDFIYYLLFVYEQLNLNREKVALYLLGDIGKNDALYEMAYTYIRNVTLGQNHNTQAFASGINPAPEHQDLILLNSF